MGSTAKGFPYPDLTDPPNGPADIGALAEAVDDTPGITPATYAEINALTGGEVWAGRTVYQTNTGTNRPDVGLYQHNGVDFRGPWNLPWGILDVASVTANQTTIGTEADLTGLTLTLTFVANRWIRAILRGGYSQNSSGTPVFYIHDGTTSHSVFSITNASADTGRFTGAYEFTPSAGSLTVKGRGSSAAGTVDLIASATNPARLVIEDMGPAGAAA